MPNDHEGWWFDIIVGYIFKCSGDYSLIRECSLLNDTNRCFRILVLHASLVGKYLFEGLVGIPTDVLLASEFEFSAGALDEKTLAVFISQSGETADTLRALRMANETAQTLAIVNVLGSTATREADHGNWRTC